MENQIEKKDLEQIQQTTEKRSLLINKLGEFELNKAMLTAALIKADKDSNDLSRLLSKKYGEVNIDIETGKITPREQK